MKVPLFMNYVDSRNYLPYLRTYVRMYPSGTRTIFPMSVVLYFVKLNIMLSKYC